MSELCQHRRIGFGSGDYYIMCRDCPKYWVLTDPRKKSDAAWPDGAATNNPGDIDVAERDRLAARVKELEEDKHKLAVLASEHELAFIRLQNECDGHANAIATKELERRKLALESVS